MRWLYVALVIAGCGRISFDDVAPDAPGTILDPALVVWLALDDDPIDGLDNDAMASLRARCIEGCPQQTAGVLNKGLRFVAAAGGLAMDDAPALRIATGTMALWVRFDTFPGAGSAMTMIAKPFNNTNHDSLELYMFRVPGGEPRIHGGADAEGNVRYTEVLWPKNPGVWAHVAMTWSATATKLYINGTMVDAVAGFAPTYDASELLFGIERDAPQTYGAKLDGAIDDVRIYSRALSEGEVHNLATR